MLVILSVNIVGNAYYVHVLEIEQAVMLSEHDNMDILFLKQC